MKKREIEFKGRKYLLIGDLENGGAIATKHAFENCECSFAHLIPEGKIMRFGFEIGTRADILDLNSEIEVVPTIEAVEKVIRGYFGSHN